MVYKHSAFLFWNQGPSNSPLISAPISHFPSPADCHWHCSFDDTSAFLMGSQRVVFSFLSCVFSSFLLNLTLLMILTFLEDDAFRFQNTTISRFFSCLSNQLWSAPSGAPLSVCVPGGSVFSSLPLFLEELTHDFICHQDAGNLQASLGGSVLDVHIPLGLHLRSLRSPPFTLFDTGLLIC